MNVKVVIFIVIIIAVIGVGYSLSKSSSGESGESGGGNAKKAPGQPDICGGSLFPSLKCDSDTVICDPIINRWRCKLPCETEKNPFPLNFVNCRIGDIKCDGNGDYYCGDNYCKNGGILYNNPDKQCSCPTEYTGLNCDVATSQCHMGDFNPIDKTKCDTCCDKDNGIEGMCRYYNGPKQQCENDCETEKKNSVFDVSCVCPKNFIEKDNICYATPNLCNSDGTEKDEKGVNIVNDNGVCNCKAGWEGTLCKVKKCENGIYNTKTLKCDCGDTGFVGNKCQYSSQNSCNGKGTPKVNSQGIFTICDCNIEYDGQRCSCKKTDRAKDDNCRGLYEQCTDQGWKTSNSSCQDIYSKFGDENAWRSSCSNKVLSTDDYDDGYIPICNENASPGSKNQITSQRTCSTIPSDDDLKDCLIDSSVYIPWKDPGFKTNKTSRIPAGISKVCVCESVTTKDGLVPKYSVRNVSSEDKCGPIPPKGLCKKGSGTQKEDVDPYCIAPYGEDGERAWVCPGQIVPQNIASDIWNVREHSISGSNKYWYSTNTGKDEINLTVYPVMNMNKCDSRPYDILSSGTTEIEPGYKSFNSEAGFVDSLIPTNPTYNPTYTSLEDAKKINSGLLLFNRRIGQDTTVGFKKFPEFSKSIKFQDRLGKKIIGDVKLGDDSIDKFINSTQVNANCAKRANVDDYSKCQNGGRSIQICADKDYNIVECSYDTPMYRYDKVLCDCYGAPDQSTTGDRCQYTNSNTCNNQGVVDYNGKCECKDGYVGDNCEFSGQNKCSGKGYLNNDFSCGCYSYTSGADGQVKTYKGDKCQYDDSICKNQGVIDDNGNCTWIVEKIFPRCKTLNNPVSNNEDYYNLKCTETIYPDLFTTNCVHNDGTKQEYGCPINPDPAMWTPYVGRSCHYPGSDKNGCTNNSYITRVCPTSNCDNEFYNFDACRTSNFKNLDQLKNIDDSGISNKVVTGPAAVRRVYGSFQEDRNIVASSSLGIDNSRNSDPSKNGLLTDKSNWNTICEFGATDRYSGTPTIYDDWNWFNLPSNSSGAIVRGW